MRSMLWVMTLALATLALVHHLLCRCPLLPETADFRRRASQCALTAWRSHRTQLPSVAAHALATILHEAPALPMLERAVVRIECLATQFASATRGAGLRSFCAEIELVLPGFFGSPTLWPPVLQPPP